VRAVAAAVCLLYLFATPWSIINMSTSCFYYCVNATGAHSCIFTIVPPVISIRVFSNLPIAFCARHKSTFRLAMLLMFTPRAAANSVISIIVACNEQTARRWSEVNKLPLPRRRQPQLQHFLCASESVRIYFCMRWCDDDDHCTLVY
jgi:hypothetical protein